MFCRNCGAQVEQGVKFCGSCGSPVQDVQVPQEVQTYVQPRQDAPEKKKEAKTSKKAKASKGGRKKVIIPVVAVVTALAIGGGTFLFLRLKNNKAKKAYEDLCDMTTLGTESYLYARVLTERILETDLATADPEMMESLFDECIAAWEATDEVASDMAQMADELQSSRDMAALRLESDSRSVLRRVLFGRTVNAARHGDDPGEVMTPQESLEQCITLSEQISEDTQIGVEQIESLQRIYEGVTTDYTEWNEQVEITSASFGNVVFLSGEVINGVDTQTLNGEPRSVYQISTEPKPGQTTVSNTNVLVDVSTSGSTFVMSSGNTVTVNPDDVNISRSGSTISMCTHTSTVEEVSMSFHSSSFTTWYVSGDSGGFTITRGDKNGNGMLEAPEVDSEDILPDPVSVPISDWIPPIGASDITVSRQTILREHVEIEETVTRVSSRTLTSQIEEFEAGIGEITVSVIWGTHDDLDLHVITPNDNRIYYGNRTADGGTLDVDMNASSFNLSDTPIENIYFPSPMNGHYAVYVRDYRDRTPEESTHYIVRVQIGDEVEEFEGDIDNAGVEDLVFEFDYDDASDSGIELTQEYLDGLLAEAGTGAGDITVSLTWDSWDDVDLHMITPDESHICYSNKSAGGGILDHDANAGSERTLTPIENIFFASPSNGHYSIYIEDYNDRTEEASTSYLLKVQIADQVQIFEGTIDTTGTQIQIFEFDYSGASVPDQGIYTDHTYSYISSQMNWTDARAFAGSLGGHLVTIGDPGEQEFIQSRFPNTFGWIGLVSSGSSMGWITGEPLSYDNTCPAQPSNYGAAGTYGFLYNDMQWAFTYDSDREYHAGFYIEGDYVVEGAVDGVLSEETLDSILTSVEAGSGHITISMMWDSEDDLDLHVFTPDGSEIYYGNREAGGGVLDIDANTVNSMMDNPVENIYFPTPYNGQYWVYIHDYTDRSEGPTNYIIRITVGGQSQTFTGTIETSDTTVDVGGFEYGGGSDMPDMDDVLSELQAGVGEITVSMMWDSEDDLDLHMQTPDGSEIYYGNREAGGGNLDVDANTSGNMMANPVENIYFTSPEGGEYSIWIIDYSDRSDGTTNYVVRVTVGDQSQQFTGTIDGSSSCQDITSFSYG